MTAQASKIVFSAPGRRPFGGSLSSWLRRYLQTLRDGHPARVPCDDCSACCTCGYEVSIRPGDDPTLETVPSPTGAGRILPRRGDGSCAHLSDGHCAIYERRPRACRSFDCRVFAACGLVPDRPLLVAAVQRWDPVSAVKTKEDAVTAAALTLAAHQAQGVGFGAEAACAVAIHGYRDYLPVARQADRLLRERPEVAQQLADAFCRLAPKLAVPEGGA